MKIFQKIPPPQKFKLMYIQTEGPDILETIWKFSLPIYHPLNMDIEENMVGGILI